MRRRMIGMATPLCVATLLGVVVGTLVAQEGGEPTQGSGTQSGTRRTGTLRQVEPSIVDREPTSDAVQMVGRVGRLENEARQLVIRGEGAVGPWSRTVRIGERTRITLDGEPARLTDLRPGYRLRALLVNGAEPGRQGFGLDSRTTGITGLTPVPGNTPRGSLSGMTGVSGIDGYVGNRGAGGGSGGIPGPATVPDPTVARRVAVIPPLALKIEAISVASPSRTDR